MELRHLRYFITVAEELNFTRAAKRLGMEQPPLSQQIRHLEEEVGTPLFQRLPRGVALTGAGGSFLLDAREILERVRLATEHAQRVARGNLGRIRVGMINSAPFHPFLPRLIREFGQRYPEVALSLEEDTTPELAEATRDGSVDVAFVRPLLGEAADLVVETLFDEEMVVALPEGHRLTRLRSLPLTALAKESFVLFPRPVGSGLYDEIISACRRAGFGPHIGHEVRQVTSIANLVAADLGVSVVPASMQQVLSTGVVYRPIEGDAPKARMSMAYRLDDPSATVRNMIELAHQVLRKMSLQRTSKSSTRREKHST
ncbi:MAG: LysR family transcriptional regulator [Nevskia sp.]|jgi:DNA-binding transcriptional LysR family regulator|nr:LysR family transcriptional regulator [Nevskia sp.]